MKRIEIVARPACFLACVVLLVPAPLWAGDGSIDQGPAALVGDLTLHANGTLVGQVVASDGAPRFDQAVHIRHQGQTVATAQTDANGYFAVRGLRGGIYTVHSGGLAGTYRAWTAEAAPPSAKPGILLVDRAAVVRGQGHCVDCPCTEGPSSRLWGGYHGEVVGFLTHPIVIGAIIATAIAVPIALSDNDSGS